MREAGYPSEWDEVETKYGRAVRPSKNLDLALYVDKLSELNTKAILPYVKEMTNVPNRANRIHSYMLEHFPQLVNEKGVWVVGSTAYMLADGREPKQGHDLDLICQDNDTMVRVLKLLGSEDTSTKTYMGGDRMYTNGRQIDVWTLKERQTIDDAINGFSSTHPQARVAYELATGTLTGYPTATCT